MTTLIRRAAVGLVAGLMLWPAAAQAATMSAPAAGDADTTFTVAGTAVTVSSTNKRLLRRVSGQQVIAICEAGISGLLDSGDSFDGTPPLPLDFSLLADQGMWAKGASSVTVTLPRDISDRVDVCSLTTSSSGGDELGPTAGFTAAGRAYVADELDAVAAETALAELELAFDAARAGRTTGRYGSARAVARSIRARRPGLRVRVARTARDVTRRGVVYVVATHTGDRRLMLAERDTRGHLHVLHDRDGRPVVSEYSSRR